MKKQPAFGLKIIEMNEAAIQLATRWFPLDEFQKLEPEMDKIKTFDGKEIFVKMFGAVDEKENDVMRLTGETSEGDKVEDIVLSIFYKDSTFGGKAFPGQYVIKDLMPTLNGIKGCLDNQRQAKVTNKNLIKARQAAEDFYRSNFGKK